MNILINGRDPNNDDDASANLERKRVILVLEGNLSAFCERLEVPQLKFQEILTDLLNRSMNKMVTT